METASYSERSTSLRTFLTIWAAVSLGPETNLCALRCPGMRNLTWEPPTSSTRMRRGVFFLVAMEGILTPITDFRHGHVNAAEGARIQVDIEQVMEPREIRR